MVDLRTTILSEIVSSNYTCLVCTDHITPTSKIWSCSNCYRAFDLSCIQDWAKRGSSTQDDRSWRCPSCNYSHLKIPKLYTCWCGKSINPTFNYLEPHSCGNLCSKSLETCHHDCTLTCHPGPHIEKCTSLGPIMKCHCGKNSRQLPCINTPYDEGWSCEEICNDILPCGIHKCQKKCHSGNCGDCHSNLEVFCYCGKSHDLIKCNERLPKKSIVSFNKSWIGNFQCSNPCNIKLDCGIHTCVEGCHPLNNDSHKCPNSPLNLSVCPCGKTKINDLLQHPRESCLDPIPTCDKVCGKRLPCGHKCYWNCHEGPCAPCYQVVDLDCQCGTCHYSIACGLKQDGYIPTCNTKCGAKFNCKRHYCAKRCCAFRKIALDRSKLIKKQLRNNLITTSVVESLEIEKEHTCEKVCDQPLSCGKHRCKEICHPGSCPPCLESSSDDLVCHCGKTVVPAPVRCGTTLPVCPYQCKRPTRCGHRPEPHHCHEDNIPCSKCTMLVTKTCQCEKQNKVTNVMCYQEIVSCFKICGKLLPCGKHKCKKTCHKPGECQIKCNEKCLMPKKCGHLCQQVCHQSKPCNENIPCRETLMISCDCGRRKQPMLCFSVTKMIEDNSQDDETYIPHIECDEICIKQRRSKMLFEALGLDPEKNKETELSLQMRMVEALYSPFVLNLYAKQKTWCLSIENIFQKLVSETIETSFQSMSNSSLKQSYHFRPMKEIQRRFIHELAETWKLLSESHDREPKRSVFIKLLKSSHIPDLSLEEAYKIQKDYKEMKKNQAVKKANSIKFSEDDKSRLATPTLDDESFIPFNAVLLKDVFFGVTVNSMDAALYDLWTSINSFGERRFSLIQNGNVEFISENIFLFVCDCIGTDADKETKFELERQIKELSTLFNDKVKEKNLAMKCIPAKIDKENNVVLEIMTEEEPITPTELEDTVSAVDDISKELESVSIEESTVSSEWW